MKFHIIDFILWNEIENYHIFKNILINTSSNVFQLAELQYFRKYNPIKEEKMN